ncbi:MAG: hypothetical protein A2231_11530 [Candidatus Firestonebacteria bacterium RIFOXYA2_FULL_40_8]|nr:MAG: hypothetical protein A2231_11530 [Candidatus Firestonebacteria bacterium RIFOXYA2_FULL_40_8]
MKIGFKPPDKLVEVIEVLQRIDDKLGMQANQVKMPEKRLLDLSEASVFIGLPKGSLYNMCCRKLIPVVRINRKLLFDKEKLVQWIATNSVEARDLRRGA